MGSPSDVLRLLIKDLRCHLIAPQLVKQGQHLFQKAHLLGRLPIHRQLRGRFQQRPLQSQQLAAVIQRHIGNSTCDAQHPLAETPEAQYLCMAAGRVAAGAADIHFRLMGGVFRHQQDLAATFPQLRHPPQHLIRFSRFGTADQNRQHSILPQSILFLSYHKAAAKYRPDCLFFVVMLQSSQ